MQVEERATKYSRLLEMEQMLAACTDIDELLGKITACCKEITGAEESSILLHDAEKNELYFKQHVGDMGEVIQKIRVPLDRPSIAGAVLKARKAEIINDVASDPRHFKAVDQATRNPTESLLAVPIVWGDKVFGVVEAINKEPGFNADDVEVLSVLAGHAALALQNLTVVGELQNFFVQTVEILVSALECLEPYSTGHVIRLTRMATGIAREIGLEGEDFQNVWYGGYFHDIGKLLMRSTFVPRTDRQHPVVGANMLAKIKILQKVAPLVRYHHERWDGSGFPDKLKGTQIPLGARILALCEDYEERWMDKDADQPMDEFINQFFIHAHGKHDPQLLGVLKRVLERA
ncbi:MAG: HD domain-containing phosphohydrolase [Candidatus Eremiobacterota bacterium]